MRFDVLFVHFLRPSKYRLSRRTECLYSTTLVSNAPLLAAGFKYLLGSIRLPRVWTDEFRALIGSDRSARSSLLRVDNYAIIDTCEIYY